MLPRICNSPRRNLVLSRFVGVSRLQEPKKRTGLKERTVRSRLRIAESGRIAGSERQDQPYQGLALKEVLVIVAIAVEAIVPSTTTEDFIITVVHQGGDSPQFEA